MSVVSLIQKNPSIRWACGGWIFFIAENAVLSENRTYLIEQLGDERYHAVYGTLSTIATCSIGYAYYTIRQTVATQRLQDLALWKTGKAPPTMNAFGAWCFLSVGLVMASQAAPKMQIPFALVPTTAGGTTATTTTTTGQQGPSAPPPPPSSSSYKFQVRCPFDFSDKNNAKDANQVTGIERISRHPGLWSLGLIGLGQSLIVPTLPQRIWWIGPASIAWLGGSHTDSRYRRNMGGSMDPIYESQTSNIPFVAMLLGKQGSNSLSRFVTEELKPLNAGVAVAASTMWILRRVR